MSRDPVDRDLKRELEADAAQGAIDAIRQEARESLLLALTFIDGQCTEVNNGALDALGVIQSIQHTVRDALSKGTTPP